MRVGLFVDVSNLYYCVGRAFEEQKIDYSKYLNTVCEELPEGGEITVCRAFGVKIDNEAKAFIRRLNALGFSTKFIHTTRNRNTTLGVNIAVDIIRNLDALDQVILGSASRDLVPLVTYLKELDKKVMIIACGVCNELRNVANATIEITAEQLETKVLNEEST